MRPREAPLVGFWDRPRGELLGVLRATAAGLTSDEAKPMIITVTMARGARRMTRKKVLVKQLAAIEDFGSIEILCSDKTGTLTEGEIVLDRHANACG